MKSFSGQLGRMRAGVFLLKNGLMIEHCSPKVVLLTWNNRTNDRTVKWWVLKWMRYLCSRANGSRELREFWRKWKILSWPHQALFLGEKWTFWEMNFVFNLLDFLINNNWRIYCMLPLSVVRKLSSSNQMFISYPCSRRTQLSCLLIWDLNISLYWQNNNFTFVETYIYESLNRSILYRNNIVSLGFQRKVCLFSKVTINYHCCLNCLFRNYINLFSLNMLRKNIQ